MATCGSETSEPIELKFGMIDYVQYMTPHAKIETRRFRGIGWVGLKLPHLFSSLGASTEHSIGCGLTLNAPQNLAVYPADECTPVTAAGRRHLWSADNRTCLVKRSCNQFGDRCFATDF